MRVVAIDGGTHTSAVSRSVECAARAAETCGATVDRIRLTDLVIRPCAGCLICRAGSGCSIQDDLDHVASRIESADGVIFGTSSSILHGDETTRALLDRLHACLSPHPGQLRLPGMGLDRIPRTSTASIVRRAVIITACTAPEPIATFFGYTSRPIRDLREALSIAGVRTVGSLSMTNTWRRPEPDLWDLDKAGALGRVLVGRV